MRNFIFSFTAVLVFVAVLFTGYKLLKKDPKNEGVSITESVKEEVRLGNDRDEYGCFPSAGYSWCEEKQKCLRIWEEECAEDGASSENDLIVTIKELIVAKHGPNSENLDITVSKLEGDYAQGGASEVGLGGGMWFAAKVDGNWELVWDGNGIITCEDVSPYPDFPADMIPECFDPTSQEMVTR